MGECRLRDFGPLIHRSFPFFFSYWSVLIYCHFLRRQSRNGPIINNYSWYYVVIRNPRKLSQLPSRSWGNWSGYDMYPSKCIQVHLLAFHGQNAKRIRIKTTLIATSRTGSRLKNAPRVLFLWLHGSGTRYEISPGSCIYVIQCDGVFIAGHPKKSPQLVHLCLLCSSQAECHTYFSRIRDCWCHTIVQRVGGVKIDLDFVNLHQVLVAVTYMGCRWSAVNRGSDTDCTANPYRCFHVIA